MYTLNVYKGIANEIREYKTNVTVILHNKRLNANQPNGKTTGSSLSSLPVNTTLEVLINKKKIQNIHK